MKRNLRLGACYTQNNCTFRCPKPRYSGLLAVLLSMCLYAHAQSPEASGAATLGKLNVGDTIPEYLWQLPLQVVNHPEGRDTITLDNHRGKLIILDFWATWCGSCIAAMPKAAELLDKNSDRLMVLPVSTESLDKVSSFWSANNITKPLNLFPVAEADALKDAFPHKMVPHLVWITPDGTVSAFTSSAQLNQNQLTTALNGDFTAFRHKIDVDINKPLFTSENLPFANLQQLSMLFRGRLESVGSGSVFRRTNGTAHGRMLSNTTLLDLYETCARELTTGYHRKRLIIETTQAGGLSPELSDLPLDHWRDSLLYTVEVIVPVAESHRLYEEMLEMLNRNTPYKASIEPIAAECYVLHEAGNEQRISSKASGANPAFTFALNNLPWNKRPIVDETTERKPLDRKMLANVHNMQSLQETLIANGLRIISERRTLNFFVIRDNIAN